MNKKAKICILCSSELEDHEDWLVFSCTNEKCVRFGLLSITYALKERRSK